MTREEAIKWIGELVETMKEETCGQYPDPEYKDEVYEAIDIAIKALEQEPCDDAISRQAVLDGIEELKQSPWATDRRGNGFEYLITEALDMVADLCVKQEPSVMPQEHNSDIRLNRVKNELNQDKNELAKGER